jgi:hypothetical protein
MNAARQRLIRSEARNLLLGLWNRRLEFWRSPPNVEDFVCQAPEIIITDILGLSLEKPEEIGRWSLTDGGSGPQVEIAGYLDQQAGKIVIAQKFRLEWRRFTTAHEIGHVVLHLDLVVHRDRPLMGGEQANRNRPLKEREADCFAAELLMPTKLVRNAFQECFGRPLDGSRPDDALAFHFSAASGMRIDARKLAAMEPTNRALLVARAGTFAANSFVPLHKRFKVSPTAMAIQLVDLGLVR